MDTVTYPADKVATYLNDAFACVTLDVTTKDPTVRAVVRRYRMLWAPGFVVLNDREDEFRRFLGYQPPTDFIAEMNVALGKTRIMGRDDAGALEAFRAAADSTAPVADEGVYWAAIAKFRVNGMKDPDDLRNGWNELRERFPESRWWTAADVWESTP